MVGNISVDWALTGQYISLPPTLQWALVCILGIQLVEMSDSMLRSITRMPFKDSSCGFIE